jgi:hypothetical protein
VVNLQQREADSEQRRHAIKKEQVERPAVYDQHCTHHRHAPTKPQQHQLSTEMPLAKQRHLNPMSMLSALKKTVIHHLKATRNGTICGEKMAPSAPHSRMNILQSRPCCSSFRAI